MAVASTLSLLWFPNDDTDRQAPWWDQHRPFAHLTYHAILHVMSRLAPMIAHPSPTFSASCNANSMASLLLGPRHSTHICLRHPRRPILSCRLLSDHDTLTGLAPHGLLSLSCPLLFQTDFGIITITLSCQPTHHRSSRRKIVVPRDSPLDGPPDLDQFYHKLLKSGLYLSISYLSMN